ncbi:MAG: HAD family phosphatase [Bacteroidota bacterium]
MAINTIIFDLGGVLIDWNPNYVFQKLIPDREKREFFFEQVCPSHWNEDQDAGYPLAQATEDRIELFPEWEPEIRAFYGQWTEMLGDAIESTVDVLKKSIQNPDYKVYALTNWSHETLPLAREMERFKFLEWFDGIVVSGEEKTRKPFLDFYEIMLKRYQIQPENSIFIDDNLHNIIAANALNINTIHFVKDLDLLEELAKFDVKL